MNVLLDTSFLSALGNRRDKHHQEAVQQFQAIEQATKIIPAIVMAEYLMSDTDAQPMFNHWKQLCGSFLPITERELQQIALLPFALRKKLKANDCLVLIHARNHDSLLFTFDDALAKAHKRFTNDNPSHHASFS